jgi:hypothetical protein
MLYFSLQDYKKGYMMGLLKQWTIAGATGFLLLSSTSFAASTAVEIIKKARVYRDSLKKYAFKATLSEELLDEKNVWKVYTKQVEVKVQRPDKLRVDVKSDEKDRTSYLNDGIFTMVDHRFGYYGQIKTPKQIDKALDFIFQKYGINAPLAGLIYTNMGKRVHFSRSKYFGVKNLGGDLCDYIAFSNRKQELHLWITQGEEPLIRSFVLIDRTVKKKPRTEAYIIWDTHPSFSESVFLFKPTKGLYPVSVVSPE